MPNVDPAGPAPWLESRAPIPRRRAEACKGRRDGRARARPRGRSRRHHTSAAAPVAPRGGSASVRPAVGREGAPARARHPRRRHLRPADAARGQALPAPQRASRSTASPARRRSPPSGGRQPGARGSRTRRRTRHGAREDRGVRERRRPDGGLADGTTAASTSSPARRGGDWAVGRPRQGPEDEQDRLAAKLYRQEGRALAGRRAQNVSSAPAERLRRRRASRIRAGSPPPPRWPARPS